MSKARVAVPLCRQWTAHRHRGRQDLGLSRQHLHRLLKRYREGSLQAVDPTISAPGQQPGAVTDEVIVVSSAAQTADADGLDAGPVTIAWHLEQDGLPVPSTSTIRRILHTAGLITPNHETAPQLLPPLRAAQPNECWQSDFTHWRLADGTDVEILNWLDDHSRYLLSCTAHPRVTGEDVVTPSPPPSTPTGHPPRR